MNSLNVRTALTVISVAVLLVVTMMVSTSPARADEAALTKDEAIEMLVAQPESAEIAEEMRMSVEAMAELAVQDLGVDATVDMANHLSTGNVDVKANFESVEPRYAGGVYPQETCAKAKAAQIVFGAFGTAICGAAAASSVGALGVPCETLLLIGTSSLDWSKVC